MGYRYPPDTGIVESLVVKIAYHPELAKYMGTYEIHGNYGTHGSSREQVGYRVMEVGDPHSTSSKWLKIEWFTGSGEVKITIFNETVGTFKEDELKANVKLLNLTVEGLPVKMAVAICNVPYMGEVPDDVRRDALRLLENTTFIKWLREEGFTYTVKEVRPLEEPLISKLIYQTNSFVLVDLSVEDLDISCLLVFDKPYIVTLNASIPEELKVSPYEMDNYGICLIEWLRDGGFTMAFSPPESRNILMVLDSGSSPSAFRRLNITDEIREEALRIMRGNGVLAKLLDSAGCKIEDISGWESEWYKYKAVRVLLACEKIKGYVIVEIDLKAGNIKEMYILSG